MAEAEIVVSRFCEDLGWLAGFPATLPVTIYDKSTAKGGGRDRVHLGGWSSADGPPSAPLWPGAIELENVGCESHTHMAHIIRRWDSLADTTVFLSGDAPGHVADVVGESMQALAEGVGYHPFGQAWTCDMDGRPHVDIPFPELREGWRLFFRGLAEPQRLHWHGYGMYAVSRARIQRFPLATWVQADAWCRRKLHSLAMERLYDTMFGG